MAIRQIRYDGDEILRKKCKEVKVMNDRTLTLIEDMFDTMYETGGVGLAAPQVGILKRIVVIDVDDDNQYVLINPVIIEKDGEQTGDEGCLSLPGKVAVVTRPNHVICRCLNEEMEEIEIEGEGLLARAICHEVDHLEGILYKDVADGPLRDVEIMDEEEE
ncbi:MAG: peptide deformylase [Lachnospiraceae bacterium]